MAFIGLRTPPETSRLLCDIGVPGTKTPRGDHHVTLVFLGSGIGVDVLAEAVKATYSVTSKTRPFTVRTTRVISFPTNPDDQDGHPVIACIESDELHELQADLVRALDEAGVDFSKKFPTYRPHVTLAYSPEPVEEFRIPIIEWGAHEIVMWGGDDGDRKLTVTFPLALRQTAATTADRVSARFRTLAAPDVPAAIRS